MGGPADSQSNGQDWGSAPPGRVQGQVGTQPHLLLPWTGNGGVLSGVLCFVVGRGAGKSTGQVTSGFRAGRTLGGFWPCAVSSGVTPREGWRCHPREAWSQAGNASPGQRPSRCPCAVPALRGTTGLGQAGIASAALATSSGRAATRGGSTFVLELTPAPLAREGRL